MCVYVLYFIIYKSRNTQNSFVYNPLTKSLKPFLLFKLFKFNCLGNISFVYKNAYSCLPKPVYRPLLHLVPFLLETIQRRIGDLLFDED